MPLVIETISASGAFYPKSSITRIAIFAPGGSTDGSGEDRYSYQYNPDTGGYDETYQGTDYYSGGGGGFALVTLPTVAGEKLDVVLPTVAPPSGLRTTQAIASVSRSGTVLVSASEGGAGSAYLGQPGRAGQGVVGEVKRTGGSGSSSYYGAGGGGAAGPTSDGQYGGYGPGTPGGGSYKRTADGFVIKAGNPNIQNDTGFGGGGQNNAKPGQPGVVVVIYDSEDKDFVETYIFGVGYRTERTFTAPAGGQLAVLAWGAGSRAGQRVDMQYLHGGAGGACAGVDKVTFTPGEVFNLSWDTQNYTQNSNPAATTVTRASGAVVCRAASGRHGYNVAVGGPTSDCIGDWSYAGGDGTTRTSITSGAMSGGGAAGNKGPGNPGAYESPGGAPGLCDTFVDTQLGYTATAGRGGNGQGGYENGKSVGGGGSSSNSSQNSANGAPGAIVIQVIIKASPRRQPVLIII